MELLSSIEQRICVSGYMDKCNIGTICMRMGDNLTIHVNVALMRSQYRWDEVWQWAYNRKNLIEMRKRKTIRNRCKTLREWSMSFKWQLLNSEAINISWLASKSKRGKRKHRQIEATNKILEIVLKNLIKQVIKLLETRRTVH